MKRIFFVIVLVVGIFYGAYWLNLCKNCNIQGAPSTEEVKKPATFTPELLSSITSKDVPLLELINNEYVKLVQSVLPSVVNISTTKHEKIERPGGQNPFDQLPFFMPMPQDPREGRKAPRERDTVNSLGSGVIISREGHIITNAHVVKGADTVTVLLNDRRKFDAKIIGQDPMADVAVLKIEGDNLQALSWGDSEKLMVGEQVVAVGNPFGLQESVSRGIVSAKGRNPQFSRDTYEDFIQTDAAINPGNSGGALVNIRGELIGINTAILSAGGGFNGIGFAIPSNLARFSLESLIKSGKVVRGYLGVQISPVDQQIRKFHNLQREDGAFVQEVTSGSPAEKAKIQKGDIIIEFDGVHVVDPSQLRLIVSRTAPGKDSKITVLRGGKELALTIRLGELPTEVVKSEASAEGNDVPDDQSESVAVKNVLKGIKVAGVDSATAKRFGLPPDIKGVLVTGVEEGSVADTKELRMGDVIQELQVRSLNDGLPQKVSDTKSFLAIAKKVKSGESVMLYVKSGKNSRLVVLEEAATKPAK